MDVVGKGLIRSPSYLVTRSRMVVAALSLTKEGSGQLPSIARVARAMNMSRSAACHYFHNPDALLDSIMDWTVDRLVECIGSQEGTDLGAAALWRFSIEQPTAVNLLVQTMVCLTNSLSRTAWARLVAAVESALKSFFPDADADAEVLLSLLLAGPLQGPLLFRNQSGADANDREMCDRFERGSMEFRKMLCTSDL